MALPAAAPSTRSAKYSRVRDENPVTRYIAVPFATGSERGAMVAVTPPTPCTGSARRRLPLAITRAAGSPVNPLAVK